MRSLTLYAVGFATAFAPATVLLAQAPAAHISRAVADQTRPASDTERDAARKPATMLAFSGVQPGWKVGELWPGRGYYTRLFSTVVGPAGKVYAVGFDYLRPQRPPQGAGGPPSGAPAFTPPPPVSTEPGRTNVTEVQASPGTLGIAEKVDLVWTSENYHDARAGGEAGIAALNKAVFDALKPGGIYIVEDHAGNPGLAEADIGKLHRIDKEMVKRDVLAAGFVLDGESDALRNPQDPHTVGSGDPSIRGKTDKFALRFRKPAR